MQGCSSACYSACPVVQVWGFRHGDAVRAPHRLTTMTILLMAMTGCFSVNSGGSPLTAPVRPSSKQTSAPGHHLTEPEQQPREQLVTTSPKAPTPYEGEMPVNRHKQLPDHTRLPTAHRHPSRIPASPPQHAHPPSAHQKPHGARHDHRASAIPRRHGRGEHPHATANPRFMCRMASGRVPSDLLQLCRGMFGG